MSVMEMLRQLMGFRRTLIRLWPRDGTIGRNVVDHGWLRALLEAENEPPDKTSGISLRDPLWAS